MTYRVLGDWGTSKLRLFRFADGQPVERRDGPGIGALTATPEQSLRSALADWRRAGEPRSIALCGMIGSRNGWIEAPYADCPCDVPTWRDRAIRLALDGIPVAIAAGLACSDDRGVPDVMRGEETQLFGAIALDPALGTGRHLLALPGTHSKWATIEDGRILGFRTFPTGEMFALLRDHSILARGDGPPDAPAEDAGFDDGVARASQSSGVLGALFEARSAQLRAGRSASWARGFLSGLLIGSEIGEALGDFGAVESLTLIGDPRLGALYQRALGGRPIAARYIDGDRCALAGLDLLEKRP